MTLTSAMAGCSRMARRQMSKQISPLPTMPQPATARSWWWSTRRKPVHHPRHLPVQHQARPRLRHRPLLRPFRRRYFLNSVVNERGQIKLGRHNQSMPPNMLYPFLVRFDTLLVELKGLRGVYCLHVIGCIVHLKTETTTTHTYNI